MSLAESSDNLAPCMAGPPTHGRAASGRESVQATGDGNRVLRDEGQSLGSKQLQANGMPEIDNLNRKE